jgi:arsenate reductase (glutaredoxin)
MTEWKIYFNPRCGSCQKALAGLKKERIEPQVIEYLKTPLSVAELEGLLKAGLSIEEMIRSKEDEYESLGLADRSDAEKLRAVVDHPILLQRPIVVRGKKAIVARPPERVQELL